MATYTTEEIARCLHFARKIKALAYSAPNRTCSKAVNSAANLIIKIYGLNDEQKKRMILSLIRDGYSNYRELAQATGIEVKTVIHVVNRLAEEDLVRKFTIQSINGGRSTMFLQLAKSDD